MASLKNLYVASLSDIHLSHPNTPTVDIIKRLLDAFPDTEETGKLDVIFIGGDVFDRAMSLHDPNVQEIRLWINEFLRLCQRRNIVVIVMEGTPSHDWKQSRIFAMDNELSQIGCDVRYIDKLSIETIQSLGITVLCVPDEWRPETDDTWMEVTQLLAAAGLEQVDFTLVHGAFTYQLPAHVKAPTHIPERYLGITRHYVFGAHVHKPSQYKDFLLVNGSFDRLAHGEEEDKGHWRVRIAEGHPDQIEFVVNKEAKLYRTIDCKGIPVDEALSKLACVSSFPSDSAVRIAALKTDPILTSMDVLRSTYPLINWTTKIVEGDDVQKNLLTDMRKLYHEVNITRENLLELLLPKLMLLTDDKSTLARCQTHLDELLT